MINNEAIMKYVPFAKERKLEECKELMKRILDRYKESTISKFKGFLLLVVSKDTNECVGFVGLFPLTYVPMPYIINNVLKLNANFFGIIEGGFPIGMILGAIMIKKIMSKYSSDKIVRSSSILVSVCMIAIGVSFILHNQVYNETFY